LQARPDSCTLAYTWEKIHNRHSPALGRDVDVELFYPPQTPGTPLRLLILNDGQDSRAVKLKSALERLSAEASLPGILVAAVWAGDRMQEYGVSLRSDYQGRGSKAKSYSRFVTAELIPFLQNRFSIDRLPAHRAIAGYSLGGLSALDIAWNHPEIFGRVGVFSGSFWWRKRDSSSFFYSDHRDRLMHREVRNGKFKPGLKFWLQTGTRDEHWDRNKNNVIDSIDDTLDLVVELTKKGYRPFHDIHYVEIKDGEHNHATWAKLMPDFLKWAFGH
jgi:enterochelin esterase-like enzyme